MRIGKGKQFLITLAAFLVLGISFKVMVLVEGLTEVRPVNAIPPVLFPQVLHLASSAIFWQLICPIASGIFFRMRSQICTAEEIS